MAVKIQTLEETLEDNGVKMLVHGMAGIGKTILCATANMPTLFISCESGLLSLKNAVINGFVTEEQMSKLKFAIINNLDDLRAVYQMAKSRPIDKSTRELIALDSISEIGEVVLEDAKKGDKDPRKSYGTLIEKMNRLIKDFRDLPHYNVLMTCKMERWTDQFTSITSYVPSMPGAKLGPQIPFLFDEVFAMREVNVEVEDGKFEMRRALQTGRDMQFEAKDRSGVLDLYEPPNLEYILNKIESTSHSFSEKEPVESADEQEEQQSSEPTQEEQSAQEESSESSEEQKSQAE